MDDGVEIPRDQYSASLVLLQHQGFAPATFIDVGAAEGAYFLGRRELGVFPGARHFFVDAMRENEALYRRLGEKFGTGYEIAAVSSAEGTATLQLDPDFYDTQLLGDGGAPGKYAGRREVAMTTLDRLVERHKLEAPYAIKLDVQGAELDALRGAARALERSVVVTAEIRLTQQRDTLVELVAHMKSAGWALFDLTNLGYSPASQILMECYATFIPAARDFREGLPWAAPEQQRDISARLRARRAANVEAIDELLRHF
jgi:FkbM family methyltransferase